MEWWSCLAVFILTILVYLICRSKSKKLLDYNRYVFITGCDSGIGYRTAIHLDSLGCSVFAGCLNPDGEGAKMLKTETSDRLKIVPLDITNEKSVSEALDFVSSKLGDEELWALINNAGVCVAGEFDWLSWRQCHQQIDVNLCGTIRMIKTFLPLIRRSKGRIINITSVNGTFAYPSISVYCATKFALEGLSDSLRFELAKFGIRVIIIEPGDHARVTNIMANQKQNSEEMWNEMSQEKKKLYDGYFQKYQDMITKNQGYFSPEKFESSRLLQDLEDALFSSDPSPRYFVAPIIFKLIFSILRLVPTRWSDRFVSFVLKTFVASELKHDF